MIHVSVVHAFVLHIYKHIVNRNTPARDYNNIVTQQKNLKKSRESDPENNLSDKNFYKYFSE